MPKRLRDRILGWLPPLKSRKTTSEESISLSSNQASTPPTEPTTSITRDESTAKPDMPTPSRGPQAALYPTLRDVPIAQSTQGRPTAVTTSHIHPQTRVEHTLSSPSFIQQTLSMTTGLTPATMWVGDALSDEVKSASTVGFKVPTGAPADMSSELKHEITNEPSAGGS